MNQNIHAAEASSQINNELQNLMQIQEQNNSDEQDRNLQEQMKNEFSEKRNNQKKLIYRIKKRLQIMIVGENYQSQIKIIYGIIQYVIPIILLFSYIWLQFKMYNTNQDSYYQFLHNQNQGIIVDFYIEWNAQSCKSSYQPIVNNIFKRDIIGCDCSQTDQKLIQTGKECNFTQIKYGCFNMNQKIEQNLNLLNNNRFGSSFLICLRRDDKVTLKNNYTYYQSQENTKCGDNEIYYLPNNTKCPVTEFGIKFLSDIDDKQNYQKISLGNNLFFYYGYNKQKLPISEIQLIKGEKVCKINKNLAFNYQDIYQENIKESCEQFDNLYFKVYTIQEEQLFYSNNLIQLQNELRHFYVDHTHNWTLQAKTYTLISHLCQKMNLYQKILNNDFESDITILKYSYLYVFIAASILNSLRWCFKRLKCYQQGIDQLIVTLLCFSLITVMIILRLSMQSIIREIEQIIDAKCVERDDANNYLKNYLEEQPQSLALDFFFYIIMIGLLIILFYQIITLSQNLCKCLKHGGVKLEKCTFQI